MKLLLAFVSLNSNSSVLLFTLLFYVTLALTSFHRLPLLNWIWLNSQVARQNPEKFVVFIVTHSLTKLSKN